MADEAFRRGQPVFKTASPRRSQLPSSQAVVSYFAISWLTKIVRSGRIWYFSAYLALLGIARLGAGRPIQADLFDLCSPRVENSRVATGLLDRRERFCRCVRSIHRSCELGEPADSIGVALKGTLGPVSFCEFWTN